MVMAKIYSDCYSIEYVFDASPWFKDASSTDIKSLIDAEYCNDYCIDHVYNFCIEYDKKLMEFSDKLSDLKTGYSCYLEEDDVLREYQKKLNQELFLSNLS